LKLTGTCDGSKRDGTGTEVSRLDYCTGVMGQLQRRGGLLSPPRAGLWIHSHTLRLD